MNTLSASQNSVQATQQQQQQQQQRRLPADNAGIQPLGREPTQKELEQAAVNIQKNYRGYRERRQLQGFGLTPQQRWSEAIKEATYRLAVKAHPRDDIDHHVTEQTTGEPAAEAEETLPPKRPPHPPMSPSRQMWQKASTVARRFQAEDANSDDSGDDLSDANETEQVKAQRLKAREEKRAKRRERAENARAMGLLYWLEAIDTKHRYGSNLQSYHLYWQKSETHDNFFHWLDHGEGKRLDLSDCPRDKLEKERVRYLSREERMDYQIKVDSEGRLCWMKNGQRIDTTEKYRDSVHGIVLLNDPTETYTAPAHEQTYKKTRRSSVSSVSSTSSDSSDEERADRYVNKDLEGGKGPKKVFHVSPAVILNHLLRKTTKKNTWIFVADISFRLYVGLKQSGSFQHSSFLNGQRVAAAGLIKVKNGKLKSLSPLSGHYRPPAETFKKFLAALKDEGVDMSGLKVSKSYGILLGLEAYGNLLKGKKKKKKDNMQENKPELKTTKSSSANHRQPDGGIFGHRSNKSQDLKSNNSYPNPNSTTTTTTTVKSNTATSTSTTLQPPPNNHSKALESTSETGATGADPEDDNFTSRLRKKLHIRRPSREER